MLWGRGSFPQKKAHLLVVQCERSISLESVPISNIWAEQITFRIIYLYTYMIAISVNVKRAHENEEGYM